MILWPHLRRAEMAVSPAIPAPTMRMLRRVGEGCEVILNL